LLKKLRTQPQHLLYASPTLLNTLCQLLPADTRFNAVMTSGSVMPKPWFIALQQKTEFLFQQYGCSEAGCVALGQSLSAANAMGKPLPHVDPIAGANSDAPAEIVITNQGVNIFT